MKDFKIKEDSGVMFAEAECFTEEKAAAYHANQLSSNRFEDSGERHQTSNLNTPMNARSITGSPVHDLVGADIKKTLVTVDGMECTIEQGLKSGLLKRTTDGYAPVTTPAPTVQQKAEAKAKAANDLIISAVTADVAKGTIGKVAAKIGNADVAEKHFSRILAAQLSGKGENSQAVAELAQAMGIEKDAALDLANRFLGGFAENIESHLEHMGMPASESRAALNHFIAHNPEASAVLNSLYVGQPKAQQQQMLAKIGHYYYRAKSRGLFDQD